MPKHQTRIPRALAIAAVLATAALAGCTRYWQTPSPEPSMVDLPMATTGPLGARPTAYDPPRPAPPLVLTDTKGQPFDLVSLRGEPVLVEFGYTHCPDVCPTTLADVRDALKLVSGPVRVVFITVDPARDTGAALGQYMDYYQSGFIGLTGTEGQVRTVADAWGITYQKLPSTSASGYAMAHTAEIYLVDAQGILRHHIFFGAGPRLIADRIEEVRALPAASPAEGEE